MWLQRLMDAQEGRVEEAHKALDMALAQAATAEDRVRRSEDRVRQLESRVGELERRCDVAETQTRRAREESDRFRSELERTRLAWHEWRRALDGWGRVALFRRKLPAEPIEFTAGRAIEDKERRT
jgi:predicted nuclease with TOPRIM domain